MKTPSQDTKETNQGLIGKSIAAEEKLSESLSKFISDKESQCTPDTQESGKQEATHTSGPWSVFKNEYGQSSVMHNNGTLCILDCPADAELIAQAPTLLKQRDELLEAFTNVIPLLEASMPPNSELLHKCKSAIANCK